MSAMQDDFYRACGAPQGLERGIKGSKAKHTTIRQFYTQARKAGEIPELSKADLAAAAIGVHTDAYKAAQEAARNVAKAAVLARHEARAVQARKNALERQEKALQGRESTVAGAEGRLRGKKAAMSGEVEALKRQVEAERAAVATWDYIPGSVRDAVADLKNVLVTGDIGGARMGENLPIPSELERRRCGQRQGCASPGAHPVPAAPGCGFRACP